MSAIAKIYYKQVDAGLMDIEEVLAPYREEVQKMIDEAEVDSE